MSEERHELPDGWEWVTLGEICEPIVQVDPSKTPELNFKYVDISSINNITNEIVEAKDLTGAAAPSRARKPIKAGDVLFATVRPCH